MSNLIRVGFEGVLALNTAAAGPNQYSTPTWTEIDVVKNLTLVIENQTADIGMRRGKGWASNMNAIKDLPIEVEALYEKTNDNLEKFFLATITPRTFLDCLILDGPVEAAAGGIASKGVRAWFNVSKWELSQGLGDAMMCKFTLGVGYFASGEEPKEFTGTVAT